MKIFSHFSMKIQQIFTKGPVREGGRNPFVDWAMILIVSSIVVILLVANSVYLFKRVTSGDIQSKTVKQSKPMESFDVEGLNYVIDKFEAKADLSASIKRSFQVKPDPSVQN